MAYSLVYLLTVLGEAASRVSAATREKAPQIPWTVIVSMRNRLVHAYFDIDREVVWKTVTGDLPGLISALQDLLASG